MKEIILCSNSCIYMFRVSEHYGPLCSENLPHFSLGVLLHYLVLRPPRQFGVGNRYLVIQFIGFQIKRSHTRTCYKNPCEQFHHPLMKKQAHTRILEFEYDIMTGWTLEMYLQRELSVFCMQEREWPEFNHHRGGQQWSFVPLVDLYFPWKLRPHDWFRPMKCGWE